MIKTHASELVNNSLDITHRMYDLLFEKYPQFSQMFQFAPKNQPVLLAEALSSYAVNIDNLKIFRPALQVIAESHIRTEVKASHYMMLGPVLIQAIAEVLGSKVPLAFIDAMREAYKYIADVLIEMESEMYKAKIF